VQGKRSCHTGYRKTAGWNLPIGYLVKTKVVSCHDHLHS
jgi:melanoma-associated antigen p97